MVTGNTNNIPMEDLNMKAKFYICEHCGNLVTTIHNAGVPLICCGEKMKELLPNTVEASGEKHLLDHKRTYYRLLRRIIADGQARGELSTRRSVNEMVKLYALCERALMYDWCLCGGEYSLRDYAASVLPNFLSGFLPEV